MLCPADCSLSFTWFVCSFHKSCRQCYESRLRLCRWSWPDHRIFCLIEKSRCLSRTHTHTDWCALQYLIPFNHGDLFPIGRIHQIRHIDVKNKRHKLASWYDQPICEVNFGKSDKLWIKTSFYRIGIKIHSIITEIYVNQLLYWTFVLKEF